MIAPDPVKRPTAAQLTVHPTVCPVTEKSKVCLSFCHNVYYCMVQIFDGENIDKFAIQQLFVCKNNLSIAKVQSFMHCAFYQSVLHFIRVFYVLSECFVFRGVFMYKLAYCIV